MSYSLQGLLAIVDGKFLSAQRALRATPYVIDEISVLFDSPQGLAAWTDGMKSRGLWFAESQEHQECENHPEWFDTDFQFSWPPDGEDGEFRIEAMEVLAGEAPLHRIALAANEVCVVHASFKVDDEEKYDQAWVDLAEMGYTMRRAYKNGYGRFAYFLPAQEKNGVYLKPRVNLRDNDNY